MTLHADIARCLGLGCPERESCARFKDRDRIDGRTPYMDLTYALVPGIPCPDRIPFPETDPQ